MSVVDDLISALLAAARNHSSPSNAVRDAFAAALATAPSPKARSELLHEIDKAIDATLFPPGSLPLFLALLQHIRTLQAETAEKIAGHDPPQRSCTTSL